MPGDTTGGHGLLPGVGVTPGVLGFDAFGLVPGAGAGSPGVVAVAPGVVGKVPQGEPLGEVPGVLVVLGLTVDGVVDPPGVGVVVELEPGTVGAVVLGVCVCGVAVDPGGFTEPVDGVTEPVGGVVLGVVVLGVVVLGVVVLGDGVDGLVCATPQLAQARTADNSAMFLVDIFKPPKL